MPLDPHPLEGEQDYPDNTRAEHAYAQGYRNTDWYAWTIGVEFPNLSEERHFAGLFIGPLRFFWETTPAEAGRS